MSKFLRLDRFIAVGQVPGPVFVDPSRVAMILSEGRESCWVMCDGGTGACVQGSAEGVARLIDSASEPDPPDALSAMSAVDPASGD